MLSQWEVVGKRNKPKTNGNDTKKYAFKIEDVFAKNQLKTKKEEKKEKKTAVKKAVPEPTKMKAPKSVESALQSINVEELTSVYEKSKSQFPDAPIVWLKELVQHLNQKVCLDIPDPVFSNKPQNYPLNVVPEPLKRLLQKSLKDAGSSNAQLFFDISLTSMATDMAKNVPVFGHKLYLQLIISGEPSCILASLPKHTVLRNSYQNRPSIGLSILWAVGQAGLRDFSAGLKIFQELMLPLIDQKNYSKFIYNYLLDLTKSKITRLSKEDFFLILENCCSSRKNSPSGIKDELVDSLANLKAVLVASEEFNSQVFEFFYRKLSGNKVKPYQDCICDIIVESFVKNSDNFECWRKNYAKNIEASAILLNYISDNWEVCCRLNNKTFSQVLTSFVNVNSVLLTKKRKENGVLESVAAIDKIQSKMAAKRKPGLVSFRTFTFLIICLVSGGVYYDIKQNGNWSNSTINKTLKEYGVCECAHFAIDKGKQGIFWIDGQIEDIVPEYKKGIGEFSQPYIELFRDLGKIICNLFANFREVLVEKWGEFVKLIEFYLPDLLENTKNFIVQIWETVIAYVGKSVDYLRNEVFVGQLSPENIQRVIVEAIYAVQNKIVECYNWLSEKVQTVY